MRLKVEEDSLSNQFVIAHNHQDLSDMVRKINKHYQQAGLIILSIEINQSICKMYHWKDGTLSYSINKEIVKMT